MFFSLIHLNALRKKVIFKDDWKYSFSNIKLKNMCLRKIFLLDNHLQDKFKTVANRKGKWTFVIFHHSLRHSFIWKNTWYVRDFLNVQCIIFSLIQN